MPNHRYQQENTSVYNLKCKEKLDLKEKPQPKNFEINRSEFIDGIPILTRHS